MLQLVDVIRAGGRTGGASATGVARPAELRQQVFQTRLDEAPRLLFVLRRVDESELLAGADAALPARKPGRSDAKVLDGADVAALFGLEMAVRVSPSGDTRDLTDKVFTTLVDNIDGGRYQTLRTDAQVQLTFPSLIPGATYRVMAGEGGWVMKKEFVAEAGKTVDLSEIMVMSPVEE